MSPRAAILLLATATLAPASALSAQAPGAYELLAKIRATYAAVPEYHDRGEVERTTTSGESVERQRLYFETRTTSAGEFSFRAHVETGDALSERVVWRDGAEIFAYDGHLQQYKKVPSLAAELAFSFEDGGFDALVVPLLLAGTPDALADPEGAAVEGPESCGAGTCWIVLLSRMGGSLESQLWVDRESFLIHRLEVVSTPPVPRPRRGPTVLRVEHQISASEASAEPVSRAFELPTVARRVEEWDIQSEAEPAADVREGLPEFGFVDEITVALFSLTARIVDGHGDPIPGLGREDLRARVASQEIPIAAVDWHSALPTAHPDPAAAATDLVRLGELRLAARQTEPEDRLTLFFFQPDPEPVRAKGTVKILPNVEEMVRALPPGEWIGVVSFHAHLKLWHDFTRDREAIVETLFDAIRFGTPPLRRQGGHRISLADHLDPREAQRAANPDRALFLVARALEQLPGTKDLIWVGWGLGELAGRAGVRMGSNYQPALDALARAEATVSVLDVTQADWHSLEAGLRNVAESTGGVYFSTFAFASQKIRRLIRTLAGYYVVSIDRGSVPEAQGRLHLELRGRKGEVLYRPHTLR